jgi:hypothetical protein
MGHRMSPDPTVPMLTRRGWAWEFLRRNPEYRRLYDQSQAPPNGGESGAAMSGFRRWGLMFRRGS